MGCLFVVRLSAVVSLITLTYSYGIRNNESAVVVVALPEGDSEGTASWENGKEILPGAIIAVNSLNNDSSHLPGANLMVVTADSGLVISKDEAYSGNVLELVTNLTGRKINIIGIAGLLHPDTLLALQAFRLPIVSLIHYSRTSNLPNVFHVTASSSVLTDSLLALLSVINHTRIGIITEGSHSYYSQISNDLLIKANVSFYIHVSNNHYRSWSSIANEIANSNIHIVYLSMRPSIATLILCEAHRSGLTWPKYAWMLHSYRLDDLYEFEGDNEICHKSNIFEGVIVFQLVPEHNECQSNSNIMQESNPFSILLHEAVWALAIVGETSSFHQFNTTVDWPLFLPGHNIVPSSIHIYQSINSTTNLVGIYNGTSKMLTNVNIGTFIIDDLIVLRQKPSIYLICIPLLFFIFTTVLLILYLLFRKDPNIKSTNVSLSMLLFLANYSTAFHTLLLLLFSSPHTPDLCKSLLWLSGLGFSISLIQAPVLVKLLQVYKIFKLQVPRRLKPSKCAVHFAPFLYTFFIISPNIIILTLWNIVDPYHRSFIHIESPGTLVIITFCTSNHQVVWSALLVVYTLLLYLVMVVIAVKTRKIRFALFKDTKKVNLLIFINIFIGFNVVSYWIMFQFLITDYRNFRLYMLLGIQILQGLAVQFTLFIPKIWPPFSKKLKKAIDVLNSVWHTIK